jgi:hypothetical protein
LASTSPGNSSERDPSECYRRGTLAARTDQHQDLIRAETLARGERHDGLSYQATRLRDTEVEVLPNPAGPAFQAAAGLRPGVGADWKVGGRPKARPHFTEQDAAAVLSPIAAE